MNETTNETTNETLNKTQNKTMNTLNFTFNFNAPVGQNIAHVDKLEAHFDRDMTMQVIDTEALAHKEYTPMPDKLSLPKTASSFDRIVRAAEACQSYFWAQSSWAVVYCVCRDHLGMDMTMSEFERRVAEHPLKPKTKPCPEGTVRKAFSNNPDMNAPIHRWPEDRARILAEKLREKI